MESVTITERERFKDGKLYTPTKGPGRYFSLPLAGSYPHIPRHSSSSPNQGNTKQPSKNSFPFLVITPADLKAPRSSPWGGTVSFKVPLQRPMRKSEYRETSVRPRAARLAGPSGLPAKPGDTR